MIVRCFSKLVGIAGREVVKGVKIASLTLKILKESIFLFLIRKGFEIDGMIKDILECGMKAVIRPRHGRSICHEHYGDHSAVGAASFML